MDKPRKVALLGGGVIGAGWAARFLINGIDVVVCDPDPDVARKVEAVLENARRAYRKLTLAPLGPEGTLSFTSDVAEAVAEADFIQESAPEREALKCALLAEASRAAGPEVIIASSTSGLLPSRLQADCAGPERLCVGHPFNPVYLLPLVEVVGGAQTAPETKERAMALYRSVGMHPLHVRQEIDAFIADRLLEAVWRESLHLVNDGIATTDEIDQAICYGPGLRWSFMGSFLSYRLAGGEAGMRHFLEQFGPAMKLPWTKLEGPELTDELIARIAVQSDAQAGGQSIGELERLRDDCLVAVLQGLRANDYGAGAVLRDHEAQLFQQSHPRVLGTNDDVSRPLRLHRVRVAPDWIDYNGHMTESRYLQVFGDASDALYRYVGVDTDYLAEGLSYYTVESHLCHLGEVGPGAPLVVATQILDLDEKRLQLFHALYHAEDERLLATAEHMMLHVDSRAGRTCAARPEVLERLRRIAAAQAGLPKPEQAGRRIGIPVKS